MKTGGAYTPPARLDSGLKDTPHRGRAYTLHTHTPRLAAALARCRAAITGTPAPVQAPEHVTTRPIEPPTPAVRVVLTSNPTPAPKAPSRPSYAPLELLTDLRALKAGPFRLLELLWEVGKHTVQARGYRLTPSQVTVHLPQELIAAALGCHVVTVWRWLAPLRALRLVDARAHYSTSQGVTRADGTLFAVCLQPGHWAGLTFDDLSHDWRDLDGDRAAGRTAWATLKACKGQAPSKGVGWLEMLKSWAVIPGDTGNPVVTDPCSPDADDLGDVREVIYRLSELPAVHVRHRAAEVGKLGAALARHLDDRHSRRWYCGLIWDAWESYTQGGGGLQALAAALARLDADLREGAPWRTPGAVLAARLA